MSKSPTPRQLRRERRAAQYATSTPQRRLREAAERRRRRRRGLLILGVVVAIVAAAIVGVVRSQAPTAAVGALVTPPGQIQPLGPTHVMFHSTFPTDGQGGAWPTGTIAPNTISAAVAGGTYNVTAQAGSTIGVVPRTGTSFPNGVVTATMRLDPGTGRAGLVARRQDNQGVVSQLECDIANDGTARCLELVNNAWTTLMAPVKNSAIHPGAANALALSVAGRQVLFTVNGINAAALTLVTGNALAASSGSWGIFVEAEQDAPSTARFSEITVAQAGQA